jgi:hypothetical protein
MNVGNDIVIRENTDESIQKIAAQRESYSMAKTIFYWQVILAVPVVVLLSFGNAIIVKYFSEFSDNLKWLSENLEWIIGGYSVTIFLLELLFFNKSIGRLIEKAAKIQEVFDCNVFNISWNEFLVGEKPDKEDIYTYNKNYLVNNKTDDLENWYSKYIQDISDNNAKLICQRSNVMYDNELRENFIKNTKIIASILFVALTILTLINDISTRSFIVNVIIPFLPIVTLAFKIHDDNKRSITNLLEIKNIISTEWNKVIKDNYIISDETIRRIQDRIYLNRKENALILDFIYNKRRTNLEEQMNHSVKELVKEYQNK